MANSSFFQNAVEKANKKPASTVERLAEAYNNNTQRGSTAVETPVLDKATAESDMNFFQKSLGLFENAGAAGVGGLRNIINDAGYRSQAAAPLLAGDDAYYKAMWEQTTGNKDTGVQIPEDTRTPEQRELDEYMGLGPANTPEARAMAKAIKDSYKKLDETGLTRTTSIGDKYAQEVAEKYAGAGDKWQRAYGISQSAGQQVLPMAARHIPVVGPLLSSLMFFGQASGGATEEALADGADWDKALTYGAAIGGVEAGTEALGELGKQAVISKFGKSASTGSFGKALSGVLSNNNSTRTMLGVLGNATSEGGEEVLSDLISPFAKSIYNDKSLGENWRDEVTVQKLWDDFLGGFAVGGLMDGARAITGGYRGQNQNYQNETVNQAIQDARTAAKEHGIFSDESIAATMEVAQAIETLEGNQATAAQDANRYRQIANEMKRAQNGDIGAQDRLAALLAAEAGISPTAEQQRSTEPSAQTGETTNETPTTFAVEDMLKNPVNRSQANRIINDANLRAEYEAYTGEKLPSVKSEAAKAVMEYSRNHAELTPMAQVLLGNREPLQQNIDTNTAAAYNDSIENNLIGGGPNGGAETDGNGIAREGLRLGRDGAEADSVISDGREADGRGNLQVSGIVLLSQEAQNILKARGVDIVETQDVSANSTAFSHALDEARSADADHGWAVTPKTAEELSENGVRSFMDANGSTGFAIAQDGDIEAVFSNKAKGAPKGATKSTIPQAIALGGTKLDCYGSNLVKLYQQYGFEPVARVKFNPEYANPGWDASKGTPDIYFMMHNGDSADTVVQKTGTYTPLTTADLAALPEMDYDTAYAYRDNLLAQRGKPVNAEDTQGANAEPLTPIAQVVLGNAKATNPNATSRTPSSPTSPDAPTRLSQTVETVRDAAVTPDAVKQSINENIENGGYRYIPESNADAVASARASIKENGYGSVLRSWTAEVARGKTSNDLFATGAVLYNAAIQSGNTKLALDILSDYQLLGTNTAQGLQAARIIKNLTPDGQLYIMQQYVKKLNDSRSETAKRKNPDGYKIDPELADAFIDAKGAAARDAAVTAIQQDIASQIPATNAEKWRALRYLNMLGNVKTQARNLLGNTAMMGLTGAKNTMLTGIEYLANKLSGGKYERNTAFGVRDYMDAAKKYYKIVDDYVNGDAKFMESNMNDSFSSGIQDARKIFGFKPLEAYRKATQWAMTKGDVLFIRPQFARYLSGYLKARGMDANTFTQIVNGDIQATTEQQNLIHNATEYAAREAQEATFHDNNEISKAVSKVGKGWPAPVRALFEGIFPFRKTPANVLVRAEEYSPLGVVNTAVNAYQAAKGLNGKTAADVINSFSKTATGTSLFALGALLAKAGLARGKEDDEEQAAFDKLQGKQDFSVVLPDGSSYTMDWLSPASVPFFMGVVFSDAMSDGDITVGEFLKALGTLTDPMIEMSMLQGVNDALDQIRYADDSLVNFALNQMVNYVSQGIGNTLYGQIERITEKNRETTYTASDTSESRMAERTFGKIMNKLPGEYNQVEYVDAWGRTQSSGSVAERAFSNLLSPGYIGKNNSTEVDNELQRLYDAGQTNVFPSRIAMTQTVNVYRNDGRKIEDRRLTKDEYVQYQKVMGQTSLELVKDLMKSPVYNGMSDEAKASAISEIYGYAKRMAAMAVEPSAKYGEKTDVSKLSNPAAYYAAKASFSAASKDSENRNYAELDSLTASFNRLPSDVRDAVTNGNSGLAKLLDARENGYTARQYYNVYDTVKALTPAEGYDNVATWQKIDAVCSMNVSDKEKDYFVMNYFEGSTKDKYTAAREAGYSPYSVSVAYQTFQLSKGVDRNGDGRNDNGTKKAAFISAMMEQGASMKSAEWLYDLFSPNK